MAEIIEIITSTNEIVVEDGTSPIIEVTASSSIEIFEVQAQGIQGIQGAPGVGGTAQSFVHNQTSALVEWIVNHNFGARPNAEVRDTGGIVVEAEVIHVSDNQLRVYFSSAQSGQVRCL